MRVKAVKDLQVIEQDLKDLQVIWDRCGGSAGDRRGSEGFVGDSRGGEGSLGDRRGSEGSVDQEVGCKKILWIMEDLKCPQMMREICRISESCERYEGFVSWK